MTLWHPKSGKLKCQPSVRSHLTTPLPSLSVTSPWLIFLITLTSWNVICLGLFGLSPTSALKISWVQESLGLSPSRIQHRAQGLAHNGHSVNTCWMNAVLIFYLPMLLLLSRKHQYSSHRIYSEFPETKPQTSPFQTTSKEQGKLSYQWWHQLRSRDRHRHTSSWSPRCRWPKPECPHLSPVGTQVPEGISVWERGTISLFFPIGEAKVTKVPGWENH